ncbi:tubulin folding cofactor D C terminal-domain-containing protein [Sphaerosporella brunnea]|uniref:Tubulin folding cofactor D C terminal-domain-containing protein n=1 Tax=Sphaerosporella brunnea TaxID=1250544 RepID=A0A5J5ECG1_9PEZI|nr:tubulin folding cofactor D C terminal-domain-containing protein [Sphaerosporella brunnea]
MDAPVEDSDVMLQKVSGGLFDVFFAGLPSALREDDGALRYICDRTQIEKLVGLLEPFQESPQLLDPHLPAFLNPLTSAFTAYIAHPPTDEDAAPRGYYTLPVAVSRLLYTIVKIRGPKIISRFLPNQPHLLEPVTSLFALPITGIDGSWELRYVVLLWLSHLLLAPFDLSTISTEPAEGVTHDLSILEGTGLEKLKLPHLSKRLLALGVSYLSSPGNRESDAAALLLIRISLRRDMRSLGLLDAMVAWGVRAMETVEKQAEARTLFLKTGVLALLAGFLAQGDSETVEKFVPTIFDMVTKIQDEEHEEWNSSSVRRLGMKIYRWVASLTLAHPKERDYIEDIIERLLNALGDRDTAVRLGASKSLAVVARKLDPDMAGDVLEAVMSVYEEDVFFDPPIAKPGQRQSKILTAVTAERWHGATLTLATFLRQRAVRSTEVMVRVVECIVEALKFEQRRSTFAVGGNVRDAACYAAWSLARSYTTPELEAAGDIVVLATEFEDGRKIIQLLATELVVAGCLDPLGNVRRASSAALQELVGRHSGYVKHGIPLVQAVDYNAVALRQRSVLTVARQAVELELEYWTAIVFGLVEGWRGVGSSHDEGRRLAATSLGSMCRMKYSDTEDGLHSLWNRRKFILRRILRRIKEEGRDVEIYHGCLLALAEVLDNISDVSGYSEQIGEDILSTLHNDVFAKLKGNELVNPVLRPELTAEATCRLIRSLAHLTRYPDDSDGSPCPTSELPRKTRSLQLWTAILEASLDRSEEAVLKEAVLAAKEVLLKLSLTNRQELLASWCERIENPMYRRTGQILALGQLFDPDQKVRERVDMSRVLDVLVAAAHRTNEVEIRVAAIKAFSAKGWYDFPEAVVDTILDALDDYAVDQRGDVGSWVRSAAITAAKAHLTSHSDLSEEKHWMFLSKIIRIAVEKLDRLRFHAADVLADIVRTTPVDFPKEIQIPRESPEVYFASLLPLLNNPQLREALLEGYMTSAGAGSDSVLRASRRALLQYLAATTTEHRKEIAIALVAVFRRAVDKTDDRITVPLMEVASLLIDTSLLPLAAIGKRMFALTARTHFKTSSVSKLSAANQMYRSLALSAEGEPWKKEVQAKMVTLLLHPFPRVRMDVADALYFIAAEEGKEEVAEEMEGVDWGRSTAELNPVVAKVKAGLC